VKDTEENQFKGTFIDWRLKLWGEAIDADKATQLSMLDAYDDDDHVKVIGTTTLPASTTEVRPDFQGTDNPDHPEQPTKPVRPGNTEDATPPEKAQTLIYGAVGLIAALCFSLGVYFWISTRRFCNETHNNYEFELIDNEEAEGLNVGEDTASKELYEEEWSQQSRSHAEGCGDMDF
jgi:kexin